MMNLAYIFKHKNVLKYIFVAQYLFILFIIWITLCVLNQLEKFVISDEGHSSSTQLTQNGAWCWFADPRAIYYKGKRYWVIFLMQDGQKRRKELGKRRNHFSYFFFLS